MKLAIIPEPSEILVKAVHELAPDARIFAPWALPPGLRAGAMGSFLRRRVAPRGFLPLVGWTALEAALRAWQRGRTDRRYRALFAQRQLTARIACWLARALRPQTIIAPSLAARELRTIKNARLILLEDLPGLRQLHQHLERASAHHPDCRFLRRFRASAATIVRQESEWVLADEIVVRGRFASERHVGRSVRVLSPVEGQPSVTAEHPRVLLAGLASARHGSCEALALLDACPSLELIVRAGKGAEPRALLEHPRVMQNADATTASIVIAPSWVECYPRELVRAAERGIPIIATRAASGHIDARLVHEVPAGDVDALESAIACVCS